MNAAKRKALLARANKLLASVCATPRMLKTCPDEMLFGFIKAIEAVRTAEEKAKAK